MFVKRLCPCVLLLAYGVKSRDEITARNMARLTNSRTVVGRIFQMWLF